MNDYATNIAIGGVLPASRLPELLRAAVHCGTGFDWNGDRLDETDSDLQCLQDMIEEAKTTGEPLRLYNDVAGGGRLEALEAFCRGQGLSYRREHDPDHGDTGMVSWWSPGMAAPTEREADSDGEPFVFVREIVEILDGPGTPKAAVAAIRDLAKRATPFEIGVLTLSRA
jgi:hypothetical protein